MGIPSSRWTTSGSRSPGRRSGPLSRAQLSQRTLRVVAQRSKARCSCSRPCRPTPQSSPPWRLYIWPRRPRHLRAAGWRCLRALRGTLSPRGRVSSAARARSSLARSDAAVSTSLPRRHNRLRKCWFVRLSPTNRSSRPPESRCKVVCARAERGARTGRNSYTRIPRA